MPDNHKRELYIALVHYPVLNKTGDVICSAVTNLDLHDIARAARTFGVKKYFVVTTLEDQKALTGKIVKHWTDGKGGELNPARREALSLIRVCDSVDDVIMDVKSEHSGEDISLIVTTAKSRSKSVSYAEIREKLNGNGPCVLLFGTAWGLADEIIDSADYVLEPLKGAGSYNHLSVRSAVSIVLDRLTTV